MPRPNVEIERRGAYKTHTSNYDAPTYEVLASPWQYIRVYSGTVTPGYKSMSARVRKKLPVNDHSVLYYRRSGTAYIEDTVTKYGATTYMSTNTWSTILTILASPEVTHLSDAYTSARSRLASNMSKLHVNLAQAMGERKQTMNLIATNVGRVVALARAIRHADFSYLSRHYNPVTNKVMTEMVRVPIDKRLSMYWLEYQYGWKPLLQDIHGATNLLAEHFSSDRWHNRAVGSAKAKRKSTTDSLYVRTDLTEMTTTKLCVRHGLSSEDRAALSQTGIDNPALLAWELLPYSFVVDWFLPVGSYLQALNAFAGFTFIDGWRSDSSKLLYVEDRNKFIANPPYGGTWNRGFGSARNGRYDRVKLYSFPGVGFPEFKNPIGGDPVQRFATAYALLRVLFK